MIIHCPNCNVEIAAKNVNIAADIAKCDACEQLFKVSEISNMKRRVAYSTDVPPMGSKIKVQKGLYGNFELLHPKRGFTALSIPMLIFAVFWLSFVAFWTFFASQGGVFFALFSIPFWLVGLFMLGSILNSASEKQYVKLSKTSIILVKDRLFRTQSIEVSMEDIHSVELKDLKVNPFSMLGNTNYLSRQQRGYGMLQPMLVPTVVSGMKLYHFFENASEVEQEWAVYVINKELDSMGSKL